MNIANRDETMMKYDTYEKRRQLLTELVAIPSISGSESEHHFSRYVYEKLLEWPYFQANSDNLHLGVSPQSAEFLTAFYQHPKAEKTVVLLSHFDVVSVENFGELEPLAFQADQLTDWFKENPHKFSGKLAEDIRSDEFLFGRGTMDMKAGLSIHISILEQAINESWPLNLVLLTVPDEEVNSAGMRAAVPHLLHLKKQHNLTYTLFLNSEPVFTQNPGDDQFYCYSGSIGKIMPSVFCYGSETHVGEPLAGITSTFMLSFVASQIEYNPRFQETVGNEETPLPVSLYQKDLQLSYSVKTPYRSTSLYNVFLFERSAADVQALFREEVEKAVATLNQRAGEIGLLHSKVLDYGELLTYAKKKYGEDAVEKWQRDAFSNVAMDDRERAAEMIDVLLLRCDELAPAVVTYFSPPYYPAVRAEPSDVKQWVGQLQQESEAAFGRELKHLQYFNGISDLSYVAYKDEGDAKEAYARNTPGFNVSYTIPFAEMSELQAPVLNVGPLGKDAHKSTERLHMRSAFTEVPHLLQTLLKEMMH